jgi:hypothetical protein
VKSLSVRRRLFLWLWPLILGASVAIGSNVGWGTVETVAFYGWWAPVLLVGSTTWPQRHQGWAFVNFSYGLTTLAFAFLAGVPFHPVTRCPIWVCATLALVIGIGGTAALWPAQRRFWAARLAQSNPGSQESLTSRG